MVRTARGWHTRLILIHMPTAYFSSPQFQNHFTGPSHPERPERLTHMEKVFHDTGLWEQWAHPEFGPATVEQIERCHTSAHVERVRRLAQTGGGSLDGDTIVSPASFEVALLASGATCAAVDAVLGGEFSNAFCAVRPPGHHAETGSSADSPWGFCLFNHVAVAARHAQAAHGLERVAILDFDVHHGNGTQAIFYDDPSVLFVSLHEWGNFPGTGAASERGQGEGYGFTLNLPLPAGADGEVYYRAWQQVGQRVREFRPELIIVSAGFDAHIGDPLGHMALKAADFAQLTLDAKMWAMELCQGRLVLVLEGGYNLNALAESVGYTLAVLNG